MSTAYVVISVDNGEVEAFGPFDAHEAGAMAAAAIANGAKLGSLYVRELHGPATRTTFMVAPAA